MRKNIKGITYVELIVVMAILAALLGIFSVSFSSAWRARASKAANSVDALLSQSKVYALSGDENCLQVVYHERDTAKGYNESGYYVEMLRIETNSSGEEVISSSTPYRSDIIGNDHLEIKLGDTVIGHDNAIRIVFNGKTGAVTRAGIESTTTVNLPSSADDKIEMYFHYGNTYCISLWKLTGEHNIA